MKYAVNEQGVQAMRSVATAITEAIEQIESENSSIKSTAEGYSDTIGPHKDSLDDALDQIASSIKQASDPANSVSEKLNEVADGYEEVIGNDKIAGSVGW